jgi:zinc transporter ZupT
VTFVVFLAALATALATGLGAAPFLFARSAHRGWLGPANAVASGVMLGASVSLVLQGGDRSWPIVSAGVVTGALFVALAHDAVGHGHDFGVLHGADARRAILIVGVMTVHSFAEGVGVGSAFGDGRALGILIAIAIAVHNIPEGLAISLVLVPRGVGVGRAAAWSVFSSLPQPLMAVPAFLFVEHFRSVLPAGLGFAAGAMVWMVARELLPEALEQTSVRTVLPVCALALGAMVAFQALVL